MQWQNNMAIEPMSAFRSFGNNFELDSSGISEMFRKCEQILNKMAHQMFLREIWQIKNEKRFVFD